MFSKWQRKYDAEAERLVEVLRQWYALESKAKRLEWELARCKNPAAPEDAAPKEARKPALLRRAEAGKSVVPNTKRGVEQSWKNRHKEVCTFREHYEANTARLAIRVRRLAKQLDECSGLRGLSTDGSEHRAAHPIAEAEPAPKDAFERMPPAMRRMRAQLEKARQEQPSTSLSTPSPDAAVQTEQEKPLAQEKRVAPEKPVEEEKPSAQETPNTAPASPPSHQVQHRAVPPVEEKHQALKRDHKALERALREVEEKLDEATVRLHAGEEERRASREAAEALPALIKHFRQGQRSFLAQPDAPDVGLELAGLIYYALTHLAGALAAGEKVRARAMYANLHTIARNLQSYKMTTLHGFDAAFEMLRTLPGGDAATFAAPLRRSPQTPGPDAQPIRACLKTLRDKASVELRPFFFDLDQEDEVITIG